MVQADFHTAGSVCGALSSILPSDLPVNYQRKPNFCLFFGFPPLNTGHTRPRIKLRSARWVTSGVLIRIFCLLCTA